MEIRLLHGVVYLKFVIAYYIKGVPKSLPIVKRFLNKKQEN